MSLCYDFQKWTIVTLGLVAISLSVGLLMQVVHAEPHININRTVLANITKNVNCTEFFDNLNNTKSNDNKTYHIDIYNRTSWQEYNKDVKEKLNGLKIAIACRLLGY